jgi:hypothetical protein
VAERYHPGQSGIRSYEVKTAGNTARTYRRNRRHLRYSHEDPPEDMMMSTSPQSVQPAEQRPPHQEETAQKAH